MSKPSVVSLSDPEKPFGRQRQGHCLARSPLSCALATAVVLLLSGHTFADQTKHVLILNSYHQGLAWTDRQVAAATKVLVREVEDLELYVEYMDTKRPYSAEHQAALQQTLYVKYGNAKPDVIISTDDNALTFLLEQGEEIFEDTPVVFTAVNDFPRPGIRDKRNYTGVVEKLDIAETIELARSLHPGIRRIVVVNDGTKTGLAHRNDILAAAKQYPDLQFEILKGEELTTDEMLDRVAQAPPDSIVLITTWVRDKTGAYIPALEGGHDIAEASPVPVYGVIDAYIGCGIVGGKIVDSTTQGRVAAELAVRILRGENPADIFPQQIVQNPYVFDDAQLQRWGISRNQLPLGSTITNETISLYRQYAVQIWLIVITVCGLLTLVVLLSIAIVKRKAVERVLQHKEQRLQAVIDASTDAIVSIDETRRIRVVNPAAEAMFGYSAAEMIGEYCERFVPEDKRAEHRQSMAEFFDDTRPATDITKVAEAFISRRDGTELPIEITFSMSRSAEGQFVLAVIKDITEKKHSEEKAREYTEKLEAANRCLEESAFAADTANRAKSEFLANMSHEIRTPMTAILGYTDELLEALTRPDDISAAKTIKCNGEHLLGIINNILDLSKIEAGRYDVDCVACSPSQIIRDVVALMTVQATGKGLALNVRFDGPLPETIQSDPTRLRQILFNLIGNAIKFTEVGSVSVSTCLLVTDPEKPKLQIRISDTGIGMSPTEIGRLYAPFTQGDNSSTRKFGGTGLGLTITHRLVELLGGRMVVASQLDKGSTFTIMLPTGALKGVRLLDDTPAPKETNAQAAPSSKNSLQGLRILLAEDGPDNQRLISLVLKKAGADVSLAENGKVALQLATDATRNGVAFDIILMDMQMPIMDGYDATVALRKQGYSGPIIALTAHAMAGDREKCLRAGCDDYLTKPINREQFVATIQAHASAGTAIGTP